MTDAETTIELDGVPYPVDKSADGWTIELRRSVAPVRDAAELDVLAHGHDALMPCRVTTDDDTVTLHLTPGGGSVEWAEVRRMPRADRLRALVNAGACADLLDRGYAVLLHPANLVVDRNLRPRLGYRGIRGVMPPRAAGRDDLLRQYQALVLSTMDPKASYADLLDGAQTLRRGNEFERTVVAAVTTRDLVRYLTGLYDETTGREAETLVRVGRRSHTAFKHAAVWLGVVALGAGAVAGWDTFVRAPFDARMLEADRQFVAMDFDGVIETLRPVAHDRLPLTQRYELASSYLRGTNLSDDQRAAIENALSLNSERDFLTYWVHVGRGDLDDALDLAKGLDDLDLVLYALTLQQEQARSGTGLSGTEREERLAELQSAYDTYAETRAAALAGDEPTAEPTPEATPEPTPEATPEATP